MFLYCFHRQSKLGRKNNSEQNSHSTTQGLTSQLFMSGIMKLMSISYCDVHPLYIVFQDTEEKYSKENLQKLHDTWRKIQINFMTHEDTSLRERVMALARVLLFLFMFHMETSHKCKGEDSNLYFTKVEVQNCFTGSMRCTRKLVVALEAWQGFVSIYLTYLKSLNVYLRD